MNRLLLITAGSVLGLGFVQAQTAEEKKATIAFVQNLQKDGGFLAVSPATPTSAPVRPTVRATSSALRAAKYFGGEVKDRQAAARFVAGCFDKASGGFADTPGGKPDVFTTAVGLMAVVELKIPTDPYIGPASKFMDDNARTFEEIRIAAAGFETIGKRSSKTDAWLAEISKLRNPDGTFGKGDAAARETGGAVAAILRLGGKLEQRDSVVKTLKAGQRSDGGFGKADGPGSDLETTYRVMRAFHMLKERPDEARLRGFIAKCRNADGGYGVAPGQPSTVSGTYFAAIVLHWLESR